ncbi:protein of unknown function [Candidatus Promineifilum breve]|uniref:Uncharacterized protein n=1 Tax=Candidatus Promineifilum breve TaxID=1806508 RepID=A0A160T6D4_9CHLR|nr:protein of unknown function [Candidatus Promineifilum breve]
MATTVFYADRRRHVDNTFDEFRFFQMGLGVVTTLEFGAGEVIAVLERGNGGVRYSFFRFFLSPDAHGMTFDLVRRNYHK